jgi:hypothetical protein
MGKNNRSQPVQQWFADNMSVDVIAFGQSLSSCAAPSSAIQRVASEIVGCSGRTSLAFFSSPLQVHERLQFGWRQLVGSGEVWRATSQVFQSFDTRGHSGQDCSLETIL